MDFRISSVIPLIPHTFISFPLDGMKPHLSVYTIACSKHTIGSHHVSCSDDLKGKVLGVKEAEKISEVLSSVKVLQHIRFQNE